VISRAVLESNAYDLRLNLEKLSESGIKINKLICIGGGAKSKDWLQIKADVLGIEVITLKNTESACLGAALLAGIGTGVYSSYKDAINNSVKYDEIFMPQNNLEKTYNERYMIYRDIYKNNRNLLHRISKLKN